MTRTVHSYLRRRGSTPDEAFEFNYLATGRHLQEDMRVLTERGLPKPDLLRGILRCVSLAQAAEAVSAKLNGLYTREVEVEDGDTFYTDHPEFVGPPRIRLRTPRLPRPTALADPPTRS
ncbi:MAG TPA: hypothetical protein VIU62_21320 [Chloroflexota bacterium]|jgi:hypothetical protein